MKIALILGFNLIICQTILAWSPGDSQPHIVFVLADDLGMYVNVKNRFFRHPTQCRWGIFNFLILQRKVERGGPISSFYTFAFLSCWVEEFEELVCWELFFPLRLWNFSFKLSELVLHYFFIFLAISLLWKFNDKKYSMHWIFLFMEFSYFLGYNDVSWNNDAIISPNMQTLVESGIKLNQFYTQPTCSPSRAALLTGLYPIHNGFNVILFCFFLFFS